MEIVDERGTRQLITFCIQLLYCLHRSLHWSKLTELLSDAHIFPAAQIKSGNVTAAAFFILSQQSFSRLCAPNFCRRQV